MTKPITPQEAVEKKQEQIPDKVLDAFNEVIATNFKQGVAAFKVKDVVDLICSKLDLMYSEVFQKGYLDVEDIYRKAGWHVEYDQPAYNEDYPATFTFDSRKK